MLCTSIAVTSDNLAGCIDPAGIGAAGAWRVKCGVAAPVEDETVHFESRIKVISHDLPGVIETLRISLVCARHIKCSVQVTWLTLCLSRRTSKQAQCHQSAEKSLHDSELLV
jgi:hypothetical protein